jgi:pimeloyl-ACP methyl ester carboxylesterase
MALWLVVPFALAVVLIFGLVVGVSRLYRTPRVPHQKTPASLDIPFEEIRFPTAGGKQLFGWWIPNTALAAPGAPTLVLVHGWRRNVERLLPFIGWLAAAGYNLLVFDARGHGSSDEDGHATMLKFARDIQAALDEALRRSEVTPERLGVLGLSIGGAAAIYAAAHDARIGAVITIGSFAHPGDLMRQELVERGIPAVAIPAILRYVEWQVGARLDVIAPEQQIATVEAPVLLIHGSEDVVVPPEDGRRLAAAGGSSATLWMVPDHGHSDCDRHPDFRPQVLEFLTTALARPIPAGRSPIL